MLCLVHPPNIPSIVRNRKKVSLGAQTEASWLAFVVLIWFISAIRFDATQSTETTKLYNAIGELAYIVASLYTSLMDNKEYTSSYDCAERNYKALSCSIVRSPFIYNLH